MTDERENLVVRAAPLVKLLGPRIHLARKQQERINDAVHLGDQDLHSDIRGNPEEPGSRSVRLASTTSVDRST